MVPRAAGTLLRSRNFVLATVINLLISTVFYLVMTTTVGYATTRLAAGPGVAGVAAGMFIVGATLGRLVAASVIARSSVRRALVLGLSAMVVVSALHALPGTLGGFIGLNTVHGVTFGVSSTAAVSLAQASIPSSVRGRGTAYFTLSNIAGAAVGPLLGMAILTAGGHEWLFVGAVGPGLAAFALAQLVGRAVDEGAAAHLSAGPRAPRGVAGFVDPDVVRTATVIAIAGVAFSGVLSFVESFSREAGIANGAGVFFLAYTVVMALSRLISGRAQDARGDNAVVYPAILSFAAGLACLSVAASPLGIAVAGGLVGLGFGTLLSAMQVIAVNQAPSHRVGVAVSTYLFMLDVGTGAGPLVLGWVISATGFRAMYLSLAVVIMATAILYHVVHGRRAVEGGLEAM